MASITHHHIILLSFFLIISTTLTTATTTITPPKPTQVPPQQPQFNTIINSIVGAGDLSNWATVISQTDPSMFPLSFTVFIPDDTAFFDNVSPSPATTTTTTTTNMDPFLFTYHIIPRRFTFSDLLQFPTGARLPTFLPGETVLITNNSAVNFTINGALITHPDLLQNAGVVLHGVASVLDYTRFGKDSPPQQPPNTSTEKNPFPPATMPENSTNAANIRVILNWLLMLCFMWLVCIHLDICSRLIEVLQ